MDTNNNNLKIYTFKLDLDNPKGYCLANNKQVYEFYKINGGLDCLHGENTVNNVISLYDINNNVPKLLNFICQLDHYDITYAYSWHGQGRGKISGKLIPSYEKDNIYFKDMYNNLSNNTTNTNHIGYIRSDYNCIYNSIKNNEIIHILINNFCKLHHIENIKVTLHYSKDTYGKSEKILETITFIIDETKESNNRKIKFYEHFSDFYRTKNNDVNYKIIQEPIGDGYCLIEEIEEVELESIKNISSGQNIKTLEDVIADKDSEIEKLKKEIQELKKFYINT
jgi:hypothetical protein